VFAIYDVQTMKPLFVNITDNGRLIARKTLVLFISKECAVIFLRKVFGKDDRWNTTRFEIKETDSLSVYDSTKDQLVDVTGNKICQF
jgi:hypothetical protein